MAWGLSYANALSRGRQKPSRPLCPGHIMLLPLCPAVHTDCNNDAIMQCPSWLCRNNLIAYTIHTYIHTYISLPIKCLDFSASNGGLARISHFTYQLFNLIMPLPLSLASTPPPAPSSAYCFPSVGTNATPTASRFWLGVGQASQTASKCCGRLLFTN